MLRTFNQQVHGLRHTHGKGRVLYFAQGHDMAEFDNPQFDTGNHAFGTMIKRSIAWLAGVDKAPKLLKSDDEEGAAAMALFPPHRVSTKTPVQLWLSVPPSLAGKQISLKVSAALDSGNQTTQQWSLSFTTLTVPWQRQLATSLDLAPLQHGRLTLTADLSVGEASSHGNHMSRSWQYEVVDTGVVGTRLLDGAFIDLVHWSAAEGKPYNEALRQMTGSEWAGQIADMAAAGIRTATIQALFLNNLYPTSPNKTCDGYSGKTYLSSNAIVFR
eukprot:COSAG06_NODE_1440_length_9457_cov_4.634751_11_plen_272_part_00